jgi:hypothetical protein
MRYVAALALPLALLGLPYRALGTNGTNDADCQGSIHGMVVKQDGKPWSHLGLMLEPAGDYDYVLPRTKSDERGHYRFSNVCIGSWGVFVEDKNNGYPFAGRLMNWFLYGTRAAQIRIAQGSWDAEFNLKAPPRPGMLSVEIKTPAKTHLRGAAVEVNLTVNRKRSVEYTCDSSQMPPCESLQVPPDTDVRLWIKATRFRTVKWARPIHLSAGQSMQVDVRLIPKNRWVTLFH